MGSKISLLVYVWMTPYKMQNLLYEWVDFSKFCQNWLKFKKILEKICNFVQNLAQNWLKFKKIVEKICNFVQNLAQNWADWYMNGLFFLEKLVFVWVYFQIPWWHIPTKIKLEYPLGSFIKYTYIEETVFLTLQIIMFSWNLTQGETKLNYDKNTSFSNWFCFACHRMIICKFELRKTFS